MNVVTSITPEAQLFILDEFIKQNKESIYSLRQAKYRYHFFNRFYKLRPSIDEKECNRLAILAAYIHNNHQLPKSKLMIMFTKDILLDEVYERLKSKGCLDTILDTVISIHVSVDTEGHTKLITLQ